jgi:hypothetical protein
MLETKKQIESSLGTEEAFEHSYLPKDYVNLLRFLETASVSIHDLNMLVQQLESEVVRLKYEVMASENEYKNLCRLIIESVSV